VGAALAANARCGNGEQNPSQVHVSNEAMQAQPSDTITIQDFEARFMGQQWRQVYFFDETNIPDTFPDTVS
jgi:hypothetical protein